MKKLLLLPFLLAPTLANATFADVDVTHPHFQAVQHFEAQDILQGYAQDGKRFFRGSQYVTRAEAVKVLLLAAGFENFDAGNPFPDVGENAWFRPFVAAAAEAGIVRGFADGQFHPEAQVTQAELLKMVLEALNAPVEEPGSQQTWYHPYEAKAIEWRLIESDPTPHKSVSRGELVELIFRAQRVAEKGFSEPYVFHGRGTASWYGERFAGRQTANGEIYDPMDLTAAHRTLPFDTRLKVTHDGKSVIVRINDRGPYSGTRVLDLS
ncbi:MAG: septal ring lytic transglycosylase RlpA family protein, partial [Candidatus Gracilibacteria bacterium]|nr:septal ring lytic transglycosylase RlpA family protein [Candidatus Gracilibacteria bacterium]